MSLKRPASPSVSPPPPSKRTPPPDAVESTYYFILCQVSATTPEHARSRTRISRCYTTAAEAVRFVRDMVRGWEPHIERTWEEFEDLREEAEEEEEEEEESKLLLRITTRYSVSMDDLHLLCSDIAVGEQVTIAVQREVVSIFKPPPPPPIPMEEVYVVVQKDYGADGGGGGGGAAAVVASALHGAYADRKKANAKGRRVLRLVGGGLDAVGRIRCRHEENMDEEGLYGGCAYVEEEGRGRVEVGVERLDVK